MSIKTQTMLSNFISISLLGILIFLAACLIGFHQTQTSLSQFDEKFYLRRGLSYVILQTKHHLEKSQLSCELALRSRMEEDLLSCLQYSDAASSQLSGSDEIVTAMGTTGKNILDLAKDLRARFEHLQNTEELGPIADWIPKARILVDELARMEATLGSQNDASLEKLHQNLAMLLKLTWVFTLCLVIFGFFFLTLLAHRHKSRKSLLEAESERFQLQHALTAQREKLFLMTKDNLLFQLAKEIAIEVNLPLTGALNRLSKIRISQNQEDRPDLNQVESNLWRISEKLKILTTLYRNPLKKPELVRQDLTQIVLEAKLLFESRFTHSNVTFSISPMSVPSLKCTIERADTLRGLYTLFENALEAQKDSKSIEVRILRTETVNKIEVRNPGPEMPLQMRALLFEPFQSSKEGRNGLSLVSLRHSLRSWGADVSYHYETPDTVFTLLFPLQSSTSLSEGS
jgi:signal transduction histidine kinase